MQIRIRLPEPGVRELADLVAEYGGPVAAQPPEAPFSDERMEFCARVAQDLLHDPECRRHPEIQALAFWMRRAELVRLQEQFAALATGSTLLLPRGTVLHLPPANVDTLFVYSWLLAFLTGNDNIVRLPGRNAPAAEAILRILESNLREAGPRIRRASLMLTYGHEREITAALSSVADVRVIWGGDATVREIRTIQLPPRAKELTFADRFSLCALKTGPFLALAGPEREDLFQRFFADAYWFDQLGCSSPRLVVWCGGAAEAEEAGELFFRGLQQAAEGRGYEPDTGAVLNKMTFAARAALDFPVSAVRRWGNQVTVLVLGELAPVRGEFCGAGLFYEHRLERLEELAGFIRHQDQTLSHFGFGREELEGLVRALGPGGLDRLVPIGRALAFNRFWDGFDLLQEFTRRVWIETAS